MYHTKHLENILLKEGSRDELTVTLIESAGTEPSSMLVVSYRNTQNGNGHNMVGRDRQRSEDTRKHCSDIFPCWEFEDSMTLTMTFTFPSERRLSWLCTWETRQPSEISLYCGQFPAGACKSIIQNLWDTLFSAICKTEYHFTSSNVAKIISIAGICLHISTYEKICVIHSYL